MGAFFYNLTLAIYILGLRLVKSFNKKAQKMLEGRQDIWRTIKDKMGQISGKVLWFHCASLGEFEQGRPIIEGLKQNHPDLKIVLTFFSPSGFEVKKNYEHADAVFYLPFDSKKNAAKFMDLVDPVLAVFIKYEFWHYYSKTLKQRGIPAISVSAIFREGQLFFNSNATFYKKILFNFDHFFVQNGGSEKLLNSIGLNNVTISGDTRFDRVHDICSHPKSIPEVERFKDNQPVFVVGSSWPNDIETITPFIQKWCGEVKFIIAPHEIGERNIKQIEGIMPGKSLRFSQSGNESCIECSDILIIDNIGMLSSLYQYGEYAYIGGAFDHGLHNTLEAATYGIPIFFGKGKKNLKYQEALDLTRIHAAFDIEDWEDLDKQFTRLYKNKEEWQKAAASSSDYIKRNLGATSKILEYIDNLIVAHERG